MYKNNFLLSLKFISFFKLNSNYSYKTFNLLKKKKIRIKIQESYLFLAWFFFLNSYFLNKNYKCKIFILPYTKHVFTLTKAPIAHKKHSKEQFLFKYFFYKITFNFSILNFFSKFKILFFFIIIIKKNFLIESNLLLLNYIYIFFLNKIILN